MDLLCPFFVKYVAAGLINKLHEDVMTPTTWTLYTYYTYILYRLYISWIIHIHLWYRLPRELFKCIYDTDDLVNISQEDMMPTTSEPFPCIYNPAYLENFTMSPISWTLNLTIWCSNDTVYLMNYLHAPAILSTSCSNYMYIRCHWPREKCALEATPIMNF